MGDVGPPQWEAAIDEAMVAMVNCTDWNCI
jgi:hypothetical protein